MSARVGRRGTARMLALVAFTVLVVLVAPWWGRAAIDPLTGMRDWIAGVSSPDARIIALRLPRIVLGLLAGGVLAVAGACFQTLLRNPLATPYTLGVSFAGAFGAFLALSVPALAVRVGPFDAVTAFALVFSLTGVLMLERLAQRRTGLGTHELLLAGVTLNFVFGAAILLLRFVADPMRLRAMDRWMMGGLQVGDWRDLSALPVLVLPSLFVLVSRAPALDQMALGEELAAGRGVDVRRTQRMVLVAASVATAAVVAVTGPIGFVGLLVPHAVRRWMGPGHRSLLPGSLVLGAGFLVLADSVVRSLSVFGRGSELPVGVLTALIGGPVFLALLLGGRHRG